MDLLLSLINITKSLSNALTAVATVLSAERRMEGGEKERDGWGANSLSCAFLFYFSRTIKISVVHARSTHRVHRPPPLFPLAAGDGEIHLSISMSLTSITYPSPSPPRSLGQRTVN